VIVTHPKTGRGGNMGKTVYVISKGRPIREGEVAEGEKF
jgi:hypothetical protein